MVLCDSTDARVQARDGEGALKTHTPPPPDFKLVLLCVKAVTTNGYPKFIIIEKQERRKQLSGYKQCYTYKKQNLEVSKYMNLALVTCNKLDPRG